MNWMRMHRSGDKFIIKLKLHAKQFRFETRYYVHFTLFVTKFVDIIYNQNSHVNKAETRIFKYYNPAIDLIQFLNSGTNEEILASSGSQSFPKLTTPIKSTSLPVDIVTGPPESPKQAVTS